MAKVENTSKGIIFIDRKNLPIKEKMQGEVSDVFVTFPRELGVEHPFKFEDVEKLYSKAGFVYGVVNRYVHAIVGEASVETDVDAATVILNDFVRESHLKVKLRDWLIEGFSKGNGFMEIDVKNNEIRVLNANNMYVVRDNKGVVTGYNQWIGEKTKFSQRKVINFKPEQIAHIQINRISDNAYGLGILYPNERVIQNIILNEQDLHKLISRKAGAPIHFKVGQPGEAVKNDIIGQIQADLQYMTNRTEWVTDGNVEIKTVDFGNIGANLTDTLNHDLLMWSFGTLVPEALMGRGNIAEGLGIVNKADWDRLIAAYQDVIEQIIEEKIFKQVLLNNGLDAKIKFIWNLPGETEIDARVNVLMNIVNSISASPNMKRYAELEIAKLLKFEDAETILRQPEVGLDDEKEAEAAAQQPTVPGQKFTRKPTKESVHVHIIESEEENLTVKEFVDLKEIAGFNYSDYLAKILQTLAKEPFADLKAISEKQIQMGLLDEGDINKLRVILKDGFRENKSMKEIEADIKSNIDLKDRFDEDMKLMVGKDSRPNLIARSETVRMANEGLVNLYKDNGIEKVRWLAAISPRTCPLCLDLNGQVFNINELQVGVSQPPLHPNCRCSLLSIQE